MQEDTQTPAEVPATASAEGQTAISETPLAVEQAPVNAKPAEAVAPVEAPFVNQITQAEAPVPPPAQAEAAETNSAPQALASSNATYLGAVQEQSEFERRYREKNPELEKSWLRYWQISHPMACALVSLKWDSGCSVSHIPE